MPRYTAPFSAEQLAIIESAAYQRRFWSYVARGEGDACWLWTGARSANGYGAVRVGYAELPAHRVSWVIMRGQIPENLWVLHACDARYPAGDKSYRLCVRTDHLFLGTARENGQDASRKGRSAIGDRSGTAKLTEQQVREIRARYIPRSKEHSKVVLAREYGVHVDTIARVVVRRWWRHVQ